MTMRIDAPASILVWGLLETAAKGAVLLTTAGGLNLALRRGSSTVRNWVWLVALLGTLLLPLLSAVLPGWHALPAWAAAGGTDRSNQLPHALALVAAGPSGEMQPQVRRPDPAPGPARGSSTASRRGAASAPAAALAPRTTSPPPPPPPPPPGPPSPAARPT